MPRNPTTGIAGCCARTASGHAAAAAPPSVVINSRLLMEQSHSKMSECGPSELRDMKHSNCRTRFCAYRRQQTAGVKSCPRAGCGCDHDSASDQDVAGLPRGRNRRIIERRLRYLAVLVAALRKKWSHLADTRRPIWPNSNGQTACLPMFAIFIFATAWGLAAALTAKAFGAAMVAAGTRTAASAQCKSTSPRLLRWSRDACLC
jgi:hypothetical protein